MGGGGLYADVAYYITLTQDMQIWHKNPPEVFDRFLLFIPI